LWCIPFTTSEEHLWLKPFKNLVDVIQGTLVGMALGCNITRSKLFEGVQGVAVISAGLCYLMFLFLSGPEGRPRG